jgi:hypothetical protein
VVVVAVLAAAAAAAAVVVVVMVVVMVVVGGGGGGGGGVYIMSQLSDRKRAHRCTATPCVLKGAKARGGANARQHTSSHPLLPSHHCLDGEVHGGGSPPQCPMSASTEAWRRTSAFLRHTWGDPEVALGVLKSAVWRGNTSRPAGRRPPGLRHEQGDVGMVSQRT